MKLKKIISCLFAAISIVCVSYFFIEKFTKINYEKNQHIDDFVHKNWIKIDNDNLNYYIYFPKKPLYKQSILDIPNSTKKLICDEYSYEDDINYSISSIDLPKKWTKWGHSLVFKVALKQIASRGIVNHRKKTSHLQYPSMEYEIVDELQHTIIGKLVLIDSTIYKIEVNHNQTPTEDVRLVSKQFLDCFHPN